MTREDLLDYSEQYGCSVRKRGKNTVQVESSTGKRVNVPKPREGQVNLDPMTVCKCCVELDILMPDYALEAHQIYQSIHKRIDELGTDNQISEDK